MERRENLFDVVRAMPLAHQITIGIAVAVFAMAGVLFFQWVSTPSMAVLYSDLDNSSLAQVTDELERQGVRYEIEAGGTTVLVPRGDVFRLRGELTATGVQPSNLPEGFELLDEQGLNVSDFRQRVDYQRAVEGELERTLLAMSAVSSATVHLVIPEEALFTEQEEPATASVLLGTSSAMGTDEIESITLLVSSAVEGLDANHVTIADVNGRVLHAGGELGSGVGTIGNRNLRMTRAYEASIANDVRTLLASVAGPNSNSVVVRAQLSFDEESVEVEDYDVDSKTAVAEHVVGEDFDGTGDVPGGTVGVEGEELTGEEGESSSYSREERTTEYVMDRTVTRSTTAPGSVEQLSVAVVLDDGSLTGAPVPDTAEIESLIAAAVGIDAARGDSIAVSTIPFPAETATEGAGAEGEAAAAAPLDLMSLIPQIIGGIVLFIVAFAFLIMTRSKKVKLPEAGETLEGADNAGALPAGATAAAGLPPGAEMPGGPVDTEIMQMVQRQPEEVAVLLRSWLADRR